MIKKLLILCAVAMPMFVSCYDDTFVWNELREHEVRISRLETLSLEMNANIVSLQAILEVLQRNEYLTNIVAVEENGVVVGYMLTFTGGQTVTIYHGKDGQDEYVPSTGIEKDTDGVYYWVLDGEWMLDDDGNKIPATGRDGEDAITPEFRIVDGYWYISYDGGETWKELGQATGDRGPQGNPGVGGDSMFTDLDYSSSDDYVILYLNNGMQIQIPTWSAFEALKEECEKANKNIEALQKIVDALNENDYVTDVTPIYEGATEIGYIITFSKSGKVTIYHGKDGQDGKDGMDGTDGKDGYTPQIGVRQDVDGVYYWTLNGDWLLDDNGNKVAASGKAGDDDDSGNDGAQGTPGKDGVTPQLKIEDGYWYVSYNNGDTWEQLGKATGDKGDAGLGSDSMFMDIDYTSSPDYVIFILNNGHELKVPKYKDCAISMKLLKVTGNTAEFEGAINRKSLDLKVTVYYATYANISVYKHVGSKSMTEFPSDNFNLRVQGLTENTQYYYFIEVVYNGTKTFSKVESFVTNKDKDSYIGWDEEDEDNKIEGNV